MKEGNADPESLGLYEEKALFKTCYLKKMRGFKALIEVGADPRFYDEDGQLYFPEVPPQHLNVEAAGDGVKRNSIKRADNRKVSGALSRIFEENDDPDSSLHSREMGSRMLEIVEVGMYMV